MIGVNMFNIFKIEVLYKLNWFINSLLFSKLILLLMVVKNLWK